MTMEQHKDRLKEAFMAAPAPASGKMAFVIDLQGAENMRPEDACSFFGRLGSALEKLRAAGIPVTWVTMGERNRLHEADRSPGAPSRRPMAELAALGFEGIEPGHRNRMIFRRFLRDHGPRADEAVYTKFYKSAFLDPADHAGRPDLETILKRDYTGPVALPRPGDFPGHTLAGYARSRNVRDVLLLGAVSTHCISESAVWARLKNFTPAIASGGVLSWEGDEDKVNPRLSTLVWQGDTPQGRQFHETKIAARLGGIAADPLRGFSDAEKTAIRATPFASADDFIGARRAAAPSLKIQA